MEKKYSEQIRGLQQELQRERESMDRQSLHLRQDIAKELSSVQEQSSQLRQKIETLEQVMHIMSYISNTIVIILLKLN